MSGGGNRKKPMKTQGWEEAGSEFYQESYPTDGELDALQRDPKHLATLLPSKQTRAVATTIRLRTNGRTNDNRTVRRQTSSRSRRESTVHRRPSAAGEVQVSMLPDLSQNLSNEQTTWEEIMQIKGMPIPMAQKKEIKAKILNEPNLRLQGYEQFKWKRRKMWRHFELIINESYEKLGIWQNDLKRIEGYFGTGVVAYFLFVKWLLYINLFIFSIIFLFITLPTLVFDANGSECPETNSTAPDVGTAILDFIQGTGFMECTVLFYGYYSNKTFSYDSYGTTMYYNMPLAYICTVLLYFLVSLFMVVKAGTEGFKDRLIESEGQFYQYCNLIFGGWDFCINNEKSATIKHKAVYNEIKACLEAEHEQEVQMNRTRNERTKLIINRVIVNAIVLTVLAACGCGIYYVFDYCNGEMAKNKQCSQSFVQFAYEFLPSITIISMNVLVPFIFRYLITFECYSPLLVIRITLFRTVFLRLASLIVLYASLNEKITGTQAVHSGCNEVKCWETYVGQQIYKLVLTDFATQVILTFFINFPRALLAKTAKNKFIKFIGEQSFDLPKHVLDVVYSQTLCWLGCFYAPLLSLMFSIIFFLMFQIKKFACLVNSKPSATIYRASRSNSMFMMVLLVSLVFALVPITYSIAELTPSSSCGPFRNLPSAWTEIENTFYGTPLWFQDIIFFFSKAGFAIPVFIILFLLFYYFKSVNSANRHMVLVLKNQLVLEGHDKQFLLERLSKFIKQQQEQQKRLRHVDVLQDGDTNLSSSN